MNKLEKETKLKNGTVIQLVQGDITLETTDAIVNAANEHLQHSGGVARSIVRRGGPQIQAESYAWVKANGPVRHESPAWTHAGDLACRYVIHAVGPVWFESGNEETALAEAVQGSLRLADELKLESIALPAISTGIFGFPKDRAARVILSTLKTFFENTTGLKLVRLVLFDPTNLRVFEKNWNDHFG